VGTIIALLPLLGAHRRMKGEKEALQKARRERCGGVVTRNLAPGGDADSTGSLAAAVGAVATLEAPKRRVVAIPTWPFDLSILSRLGVTILPIVVGLVTQIVANLLGL
jgi:hypothetical protein